MHELADAKDVCQKALEPVAFVPVRLNKSQAYSSCIEWQDKVMVTPQTGQSSSSYVTELFGTHWPEKSEHHTPKLETHTGPIGSPALVFWSWKPVLELHKVNTSLYGLKQCINSNLNNNVIF